MKYKDLPEYCKSHICPMYTADCGLICECPEICKNFKKTYGVITTPYIAKEVGKLPEEFYE